MAKTTKSKEEKTQFNASFKIRNRITGLYAKKDVSYRNLDCKYGWSTTGKVWSSLGHLKQHLSCHGIKDFSQLPINLELVVQIEVPNTYIPLSGIQSLTTTQIIDMAIEQANFGDTKKQKS